MYQTSSFETRPKRPRRSYACGPCKQFKIKCNLATPCSSCVRCNRTSKCLHDPPRPPSAEELSKKLDRRHRGQQHDRGGPRAWSGSETPPPSLTSAPQQAQQVSQALEPGRAPTVVLPHIQPPMVHVSPSAYVAPQPPPPVAQPVLPQPPSPYAPIHPAPFIFRESRYYPATPAPPAPPVPPHPLLPHISQTQTPVSGPATMQWPHQGGIDLGATLDSGSGSPVEVGVAAPPSGPGPTATVFDGNILTFSHADRATLHRLLPQTPQHAQHLFRLALQAQSPQSVSRRHCNACFELYPRFFDAALDLETARALTVCLALFAAGAVFDRGASSDASPAAVATVSAAKAIRHHIVRHRTIADILYLVDLYFVLHSYYEHTEKLEESYLELNALFARVLLCDDFLEAVADAEVFTGDRGAMRAWMRLRSLQIGVLYFEARGTLLDIGQLKDSVLPRREAVRYAYGAGANADEVEADATKADRAGSLDSSTEELGDTANAAADAVSGAAESRGRIAMGGGFADLDHFFTQIWAVYYQRSSKSLRVAGMVRSYLGLYCDSYCLISSQLTTAERHQRQYPQHALSRDAVRLYARNQILLVVFVRSMSFVRIESTYFPSLRYTSYLTSVLSIFNHLESMWRATRAVPGCDVVRVVVQECGLHPIRFILHAFVYVSCFLLVVASFLDSPHASAVLDLPQLYERARAKHIMALSVLDNSDDFQRYYAHVPAFSSALRFTRRALLIAEKWPPKEAMHTGVRRDRFRDFLETLENHAGAEDCQLVAVRFFGSHDAMTRYLEKVWDLFAFLTAPSVTRQDLMITPELELSMDLVDEYRDRWTGLAFSDGIVEAYMKHVSEPHLAAS
ncbi:hypothetical protein ABC855_g3136 [[Candida] zeylanoides]